MLIGNNVVEHAHAILFYATKIKEVILDFEFHIRPPVHFQVFEKVES